MAKIKVKGVKELSARLNRNLRIELNKIFRDKALRDRVGRIVVNDIKENVEFGPPAPSTLKWREAYDPINKTDPVYDRNKIKAVFTGELLEDLAKNVKGFPTELTFEVAHSSKKHRKYQGKTKKIGSGSTYREISEGLINDLGYDYFKISDEARQLIVDEIREAFFNVLANIK